MTNINNSFPVSTPQKTGDDRIDGILGYQKWGNATFTYSFPETSKVYYDTGYHDNGTLKEAKYFFEFNEQQKKAVHFALDKDIGGAASAGFAVEGFTNLKVSFDATADSTTPETFRFGNTKSEATPGYTGHANTPGNYSLAGDVWMDADYVRNPVAGEVGWRVILHELGHALGLTHAVEENGGWPSVPEAYINTLMTVESGRAYPNSPSGVDKETWGDSQTWMMLDIAALQHLYGANYTVNSGNTVYKWTPDSGNTYVNGGIGIKPGANRITATIWDGGGVDTYDLSAYKTNLRIDLRPGEGSKFSEEQAAKFTDGTSASANIFNAMLHKGNTRSLIENAKGGSGNDTITGNQGKNNLWGYSGNDTLYGGTGNDRLYGGDGTDKLYGGNHNDYLYGGTGNDRLDGGAGNDWLKDNSGINKFYGGSGTDSVSYYGRSSGVSISLNSNTQSNGDYLSSIENLYGTNSNDDLYGNSASNKLDGYNGNDSLYGYNGNDYLYGGSGNDMLNGQDHNDHLYGGAGNDTLHGEWGDDKIYGGNGNDRLNASTGSDYLHGGAGADIFIFGDGLDQNRIYDFNVNQYGEKIDLSAVSYITDYNDLRNNHMVAYGNSTKINVDSTDYIIINNVALNSLTADDFIF